MVRILRISIIFSIIVFLAGCTVSPVNTTNAPTSQTTGNTTYGILDTVKNDFRGDVSGDWEVQRSKSIGALSNEGYYYTAPRGFLYFYDPASRLSVRLCSDVNCLHEEETQYEKFWQCEAFISGYWMTDVLFVTDEAFYYIESDYNGSHLYSRDLAGMHEKKVATLAQSYWEPDRNILVNNALVQNCKLYYTVDVEGFVWNEEEQLNYIEREFSAICCLDLQTGEETELVRTVNPKEQILVEAVSNNAILYVVTIDVGTEDARDILYTMVLHSTEGQGSRIVWQSNTGLSLQLDVHDGVFYTEEEAEDSSVTMVGYDLLTSEVKFQAPLPAKNLQYLNERYRLHYAWSWGTTISIYDISTGAFLDGSIDGRAATVYNVNDTGFILKDSVPSEESANIYKGQRIFYCAFASLEDGFQQEDLQLILTMGDIS